MLSAHWVNTAMPRVELDLLGPFRARLSSGASVGLPTRKTQALLAFLAVRPGQVHARDKLAALLWGDAGEPQARQSLRHALSAIRRAVPRGAGLLHAGDSVRLSPATVRVDVPLFERLVAQGSAKALAEAASLYRGDLLEGIVVKEEPFEDWLRTERQRLREIALGAFTRVLAAHEKRGALEQAIQIAVRLLALDASQENIHRRLMRLYARQGRRAAALRQYQTCVEAVRRELGTEPETQTKVLYQELLRDAGRTDRRPVRAARSRGADVFDHHDEVRLVGREPELARLRRNLEEAGRGHGRLVLITGEAGIGKSRLLSELVRVAASRGFPSLVGRCYQSEQILPFGPWIDALRTSGIASEPDILDGLGPAWRGELARLLPEAAEPGWRPPAVALDFVRLFEAVLQLVATLAARSPLLVIVEDLHWADEMSLRLLAFLGRRTRGTRVLLVGTAREEEIADSPVLHRTLEELNRGRAVEQLALGPLSEADTLRLAGSWAGAGRDARQLGQRIWRASGGNPFMAVETIRALQEEGGAEASATLPLPRRVHEVIAGRLGRLSQPARLLAAVAAVIGREFDFALLQRGARFTRGRTAEAIEELVRRRLVHGVGERFDFAHDRIREVAYQEVLGPRRKLLHGQVARALEGLHGANLEPYSGAIGMHYQEAEVWDRALAFLRQGGAHSFGRSASREATDLLERALAALEHLPETRTTLENGIDLRFELRNALYHLGELPRVLAYLREAERLTHRLDDPRRLGRLALYMAAHLWLTGEPREAGDFAERSRAIGARLGDLALDVWARYYLGLTCFASGRYEQAASLLRALTEQLQGSLARDRLGMSGFPIVLAHAWLARALAEQGKFSEGLAHGQESVRLGEELDHPYSLIFACWHLAHLESVRGHPAGAIAWAERGVALAGKWEVALLLPLVTWQLGYARTLAGDARHGLPQLDEALTSIRSMGMGAFLPVATLHRGEALSRAGRFDEALESADHALALARQHGQPGVEAGALGLRGQALARLHPAGIDAVGAEYGRALALAEKCGMRPLIARCHAGLGALSERALERTAATRHLGEATALLEEMGMEFWLQLPEG